MTTSERSIEQALALVAQSRNLRERAEERRRDLRRKTEMMSKPLYILKKNGGRQLSLRLDS
ncbi:hypothetical protein QE435_004360 [Rhizobium sp. SORGH_AS 787]|uniref:Uncharacterized protein n=1 Tax=Agrobacterium larrymoorei TaxID=160699 RepID=A0AAJ2BMR2_9HYPH|nr:hypothetical protein [Agrobacterium larrymoorei]MDQ1198650.1 hypothetical protein [Rhizobium sp. SORGH_AS_0787]MDR6102440.1 hypothetical protein [Agrobacterium larrymoorei]